MTQVAMPYSADITGGSLMGPESRIMVRLLLDVSGKAGVA